MRKKSVLIIILTAIIFLSVVTLGVSTVYRVDSVTVKASVVSEEAKAEAQSLEERLTKAYKKQSVFLAEKTKAQTIVEEFPYFRLTGFTRDFPNRLIVQVSEDMEAYAVATDETEQSYYLLGRDGTVLGIREDMENRSGKVENIPIKGLKATGTRGEPLKGDYALSYLFSLLDIISARLDGAISRNIVCVELLRPSSQTADDMVKLTMREGVSVYITNPATGWKVKAEKAMDKYLSLGNGGAGAERLTGRILVWGTETEATAVYDEKTDVLPIAN